MCLTHPPISFFFTDTPTTEIYTLSLHDALPISALGARGLRPGDRVLIAAPNSPELVHVWLGTIWAGGIPAADRKSTRLNSSHRTISYAVFCLKKKKKNTKQHKTN